MTKPDKYTIDVPDDLKKALGRIVVQWAHLDESLTSQIRILLGECDASSEVKIPSHLRIAGSDRLQLYRALVTALYPAEEQRAAGRALDQIANVRAHRERLIHGNITPQENGRLLVHYAEEKPTGKLKGENHWYTVDQINVVADQIAEADAGISRGFAAYFNRKAT